MQSNSKWLAKAFFIFAVGTTLCWTKIIYEIDRQPYFIDEVSDTVAALHFFEFGNYSSPFFDGGESFGPGLSVGLTSSWPGGLVWWLGGGLFESRIALALVGYLQILLVFTLAFGLRYLAFGPFFALLIFQIPYWYGFFLNVGELSGALWMALGGLLTARRRLYAGAFSLGLAVWGCKFIYFPVALCFLVLGWLANGGKRRFNIKTAGIMSMLFMVPLFCFLFWIVVMGDGGSQKSGVSGAVEWMDRFLDFIRRGNSGLDGKSAELRMSLLERLQAPLLEWHQYTLGWKLRFLIFGGVPLITGILALFHRRRDLISKIRKGRLAQISSDDLWIMAMVLPLGFYGVWYFCMSPTMMIRHAQPGLYLGLALGLFLLVRKIGLTERGRIVFLILGLIFTTKEVWNFSRLRPVLQTFAQSYPRNCQESLMKYPCVPREIEAQVRKVCAESGEIRCLGVP